MKYIKKPIVIEAIQWDGSNYKEIKAFGDRNVQMINNDTVSITTLEGEHLGLKGDFIIKGVKGEIYPCKPDIFEMTYEKVEGE